MAIQKVSIYSKGGSEYILSVAGNVVGDDIYASAGLEPKLSGASFAASSDRTLTVSILDSSSNVLATYTKEITACSKNNPASVTANTRDVSPLSSGTYTVSATWFNNKYKNGTYPPGPTTTIFITLVIEDDGTIKVYSNNAWGKCIPYVRIGGAWKKAKAYVYHNSQWKEGK